MESDRQTRRAFDPDSSGLEPPPWEDRARFGLLNGLYLTIRDVLLAPGAFFSRMPTRLGLSQPLLFALIIGVLSSFFDWTWTLAGSSLRIVLGEDFGRLLHGPLYSGFFWIFSPLVVVMMVFVRAGVVHLCVLLLGGGRFGFEATFRAVTYADAVWILAILPFCGNLVALFWGTTVTIIGLQRVQQLEGWRAVLAVLLPLVLCLASCGSLSLLSLGMLKGLDSL